MVNKYFNFTTISSALIRLGNDISITEEGLVYRSKQNIKELGDLVIGDILTR